jgi:cell division septal protein FtsQ
MSSRPLQLRRRSKPSLGARARTYWIPAILAIAVAAGLGWALAAAPMFRLSRIDVVGNGRVAGSDVIARANLNPNENVWLADVRGAERRIEAIPYVLSAHVHRRFPAAVRISIVERVPEACLRDANENQFTVDAELRVLAAGCSQAPDLAYVSRSVLSAKPGDFVTDQALVALRRDAQALAAPASAAREGSAPGLRFTTFAFDAAGQLDATLAGGVRVRFGDDDGLAEKERLVMPILASLGPRAANVRAVDVRSPSTPVVEFR